MKPLTLPHPTTQNASNYQDLNQYDFLAVSTKGLDWVILTGNIRALIALKFLETTRQHFFPALMMHF